MFEVCVKCGYDLELLNGVWVDSYDEDEVCYDEDTNMIGDGKHEVSQRR